MSDRLASSSTDGPSRFIVAGAVLLLAACTGRPSVSANPTLVVTTASPAAIESAALPSPPPATANAADEPPLLTQIPPGAASAWTGISWRQLVPDDPLALVRSMLRWRGGYVAVGAAVPGTSAGGSSATTPVWVSVDGATWRRLGPEVFGPTALVVGIEETAGGIAALTLQSGKPACGGLGDEGLWCWSPALPLQAWTSSDGANWAAHPGPDVELFSMCGDCGVDPPVYQGGRPGLVAFGAGQAAFSSDGLTWDILPADAAPSDIGVKQNGLAGFGPGFVAVGEQMVPAAGTDRLEAIGFTSSDGRRWTSHPMVTTLSASYGTGAHELVVGPGGVIAMGSTQGDPGSGLWWSTLDGVTWTELAEYPPLGVWYGEGPGSGASENGTLVGNGERMLAYRSDAEEAAWTSFDGMSWRSIKIEGGPPAWDSTQHPGLILLPAGVLGFGREGAVWFGEPLT
jgi:hypothetical protein